MKVERDDITGARRACRTMSHVSSRDAAFAPLPAVRAAVIDVLAAEPSVAAAYVFGSVASESAGPLSDIDVALLVSDAGEAAAVCDRAMDALCRRLRTSRVDVLSLADAPVPLRYRVVRDGSLVLRRDAARLERFIVDTVLQYLDFQPLRERAFQVVRAGILENR